MDQLVGPYKKGVPIWTKNIKINRPGIYGGMNNPVFDFKIIDKLNLEETDGNISMFWNILEKAKFGWGDVGEACSSLLDIQRAIINSDSTRFEFLFVREFMKIMINRLKEKVSQVQSYSELDDGEKNKLLSHVIGKGRGFYNMVCSTNDIISYLIEKKLYVDFTQIFVE